MSQKFFKVVVIALLTIVATIPTSFAKERASQAKASLPVENCAFSAPSETVYKANFVSLRRQLKVSPGEAFRVKVFLKNSGNMPWFSNNSTCLGPKMSLGTDKERDSVSQFYSVGLEGWESSNRIAMDQLRVNPGEIASFTFWGKLETEDVYKQYLTPVLKDLTWIDDAGFDFTVIAGENKDDAVSLRKKMEYSSRTGSVLKIDLNAEKTLLVDKSEQRLFVKLGEDVIKEFPVSSGGPGHVTPSGETSIKLKQDVRISGKTPHYIMPKFMWFREGGFGFHALPSLGSSTLRSKIKALQAKGEEVPTELYLDDPFWTEARNHMGRPVSHGCVRLLPEDADWLYDFTEIGTKVVVQQ